MGSRRLVKVVLPGDAVARKRRNVEELQPPTEEDAEQAKSGQASDPFMAESPTTAIQEAPQSYSASTSAMFNNVYNKMRNNFWLGTVAPAAGLALVARTILIKSKARVEARTKSIVNNYAFEMLKYDGNLPTLKEVHADYQSKGAKGLKDECVLEYLRRFFNKKVVSGSSVKSLAFMVALNNLNDVKAAELLRKFGEENMGKPVTLGKVVFFAERVLKDPKALDVLAPIKEEAVDSFGAKDPDKLVYFEASQKQLKMNALDNLLNNLPEEVEDLDDARELCSAEGKLLGLSEEESLEAFDTLLAEQQAEAAAEEAKYAEEEEEDEEEDEGEVDIAAQIRAEAKGSAGGGGAAGGGAPSAGGKLIVQCNKCQNTMFIAEGRASKFFGPDFKCSNCGAGKDDQTVREA